MNGFNFATPKLKAAGCLVLQVKYTVVLVVK